MKLDGEVVYEILSCHLHVPWEVFQAGSAICNYLDNGLQRLDAETFHNSVSDVSETQESLFLEFQQNRS